MNSGGVLLLHRAGEVTRAVLSTAVALCGA